MRKRSIFSTGPLHYESFSFKWLFESSTFTRLSPCTGAFIVSIFLQGQAHLSFSILFNVLTDLIEMTGKIYGIWSLSTLCFFFFFFFWQDDKKIIYTWGIDTCWEWCGYKLPGILRNAERMSCATIFWYHLHFSPLTSAHSHRFQQVSTETVFTCAFGVSLFPSLFFFEGLRKKVS